MKRITKQEDGKFKVTDENVVDMATLLKKREELILNRDKLKNLLSEVEDTLAILDNAIKG